ncbi:MAG: rhodanese-like domain-containing protein [Chitinophagaceae bacterium]|nr:rhodanese-like domain-containing protein [Chitinophagaceae bacterium]MBN8668023.1 rhodanese-like domain-containing protein [Chitinophagales bacterium]
MRLLICLLFMGMLATAAAQPYRFDNKLFTNIFPEDLCDAFTKNPGYVIIDVRSPGEYADTSGFDGANIGRLKGALNIPVGELPKRWKELDAYKDKAVFLYCSHSQRSRRASKFLSDSGFSRVFNINGGMSRILSEKNKKEYCLNDIYTSGLPYRWLTAKTVMENSIEKNPFFIIDTRSDSAYRGIASAEALNHLGKIKGATHIPADQIMGSLKKIPQDKPLLLIDAFGEDVTKTARLLVEQGYTEVNVLYGGLEDWIEAALFYSIPTVIRHQSNSPFKMAGPEQAVALINDDNSLIIDIRKTEVFENKSPDSWENIGHLKKAVNVPAKQWEDGHLMADKKKPILIYSISMNDEVFKTALLIRKLGFKNIYILHGGLWGFRRNANNLKGKMNWNDLVVDVPEANY